MPRPRRGRRRGCRRPRGRGTASARMSRAIAVGRVVEGGDEHEAVGDVEVRVAGRQALAVEDHRRGHGQRRRRGAAGRPGRRAALRRRRFSSSGSWLGSSASGSTTVTTVFGSTNRARSSTCPWVSSPSIPRPSQITLVDAQVVGEDALDPLAAEPGIARLDVAQQAFLGRQQRPPAVDVDRAPFQHDPPRPAVDARPGASSSVSPSLPSDPPGKMLVLQVVVVLRPGVELPVDQTDRAEARRRVVAVADHERRAGVAEPDAVGLGLEEADAVEVDARLVQSVGRPALRASRSATTI